MTRSKLANCNEKKMTCAIKIFVSLQKKKKKDHNGRKLKLEFPGFLRKRLSWDIDFRTITGDNSNIIIM